MSARLYLMGADLGRLDIEAETDGDNLRLVIADERMNSASFLLSRAEAETLVAELTAALKGETTDEA